MMDGFKYVYEGLLLDRAPSPQRLFPPPTGSYLETLAYLVANLKVNRYLRAQRERLGDDLVGRVSHGGRSGPAPRGRKKGRSCVPRSPDPTVPRDSRDLRGRRPSAAAGHVRAPAVASRKARAAITAAWMPRRPRTLNHRAT